MNKKSIDIIEEECPFCEYKYTIESKLTSHIQKCHKTTLEKCIVNQNTVNNKPQSMQSIRNCDLNRENSLNMQPVNSDKKLQDCCKDTTKNTENEDCQLLFCFKPKNLNRKNNHFQQQDNSDKKLQDNCKNTNFCQQNQQQQHPQQQQCQNQQYQQSPQRQQYQFPWLQYLQKPYSSTQQQHQKPNYQ